MKLASYQQGTRRSYGPIVGDKIYDLPALGLPEDFNAALESVDFRALQIPEDAPSYSIEHLKFLPAVPNPRHIWAMGLNYESHRLEVGAPASQYPTLFTRYASSLTAHNASIVRPKVSADLDYEGELAVVIGRRGRYVSEEDAADLIFGYSCFNDASVRDWQLRTSQFAAGKNFPCTGAFGPIIVTRDDMPPLGTCSIETRVNGLAVQRARLDELIFPVEAIVAYVSNFCELLPGDVIITGTPGGVALKRGPSSYLKDGDLVEVEISGIGVLSNHVRDEDLTNLAA